MNIFDNRISADHGMVVLMGTAYSHHDKMMVEKTREAIKKNNALHITVIDFEDKEYNTADLLAYLQNFLNSHKTNTVIIGIHGAQAFPLGNHYSIVGPNYSTQFGDIASIIYNALQGNIIRSSEILKVIGKAAQEKPIDVWQFTCQGAKLIDYAQEYLPMGSNYIE